MVLIGIETKEQQRDIVGGHVADCCKKAEGLLSSMNKSQGDTESIGNKGIEAKKSSLLVVCSVICEKVISGHAKLTV